MQEKTITYIFGDGRLSKINDNSTFAKEMYYGYFELKKSYDTELIEVQRTENIFRLFFSKIFTKATGLGINFFSEFSKSGKNRILNSQELFFGNQQLLLSFLYLLPTLKNKNININVFAMGLLSGKNNFISDLVMKYLFIFTKRIIFISKVEFNAALKKYPKQSSIFFYIPFGVDTAFWSKIDCLKNDKKSILFIGNDLNRDYSFLIKLVKALPNLNFKVVSKRITNKELNFENVEIFNGDWHSNLFPDTKIRELYNSSSLTIIPLKNTIQPSGQSVCLQSMACETPVIITKTDGFWDPSNIKNELDLFLLPPNLNEWIITINKLLENEKGLDSITKNAKDKIFKQYNTNLFNQTLIKILET